MNPKRDKAKKDESARSLARAMRDSIIAAPESGLRAAFAAAGHDFGAAAKRARTVVERALKQVSESRAKSEEQQSLDLHRSLGSLITVLRKRDHLTVEELAERARVDQKEVRSIESDPTFTPKPRTIYQLEQTFKLPERTLGLLSGEMKSSGDEVIKTALRFAAKSEKFGSLSREERRDIAEFIKFLTTKAGKKPE